MEASTFAHGWDCKMYLRRVFALLLLLTGGALAAAQQPTTYQDDSDGRTFRMVWAADGSSKMQATGYVCLAEHKDIYPDWDTALSVSIRCRPRPQDYEGKAEQALYRADPGICSLLTIAGNSSLITESNWRCVMQQEQSGGLKVIACSRLK